MVNQVWGIARNNDTFFAGFDTDGDACWTDNLEEAWRNSHAAAEFTCDQLQARGEHVTLHSPVEWQPATNTPDLFSDPAVERNNDLRDGVTIGQKIDAINREIKLRRYVYPRRVENGKMSRQAAQQQILVMEAILRDYMERF